MMSRTGPGLRQGQAPARDETQGFPCVDIRPTSLTGFEAGPTVKDRSVVQWSGHAQVPLCPQWPRINSCHRVSVGPRHLPVIRKISPDRTGLLGLPPASLPRFGNDAGPLHGKRMCQGARLAHPVASIMSFSADSDPGSLPVSSPGGTIYAIIQCPDRRHCGHHHVQNLNMVMTAKGQKKSR